MHVPVCICSTYAKGGRNWSGVDLPLCGDCLVERPRQTSKLDNFEPWGVLVLSQNVLVDQGLVIAQGHQGHRLKGGGGGGL